MVLNKDTRNRWNLSCPGEPIYIISIYTTLVNLVVDTIEYWVSVLANLGRYWSYERFMVSRSYFLKIRVWKVRCIVFWGFGDFVDTRKGVEKG